MKWFYLPWRYKSADTATKVLNMILYVMGCLIIFGILMAGYYMVHVHTLNSSSQYAASHRATQNVPVNVDHRRYQYIYHTDVGTYKSAEQTIQNAIEVASKHDMSSGTDRIYWLRKYLSMDELNDDSNPLANQRISLKHGFIGFDTSNHDQDKIKFVVKGNDIGSGDGSSNSQSASSIMTGTFDGTSHKITDLSNLDDGQ